VASQEALVLVTLSLVFLSALAAAALVAGGVRLYLRSRYLPTIVRIFEEAPFFAATLDEPAPDARDVSFRTADGLTLRGSYWPTTASDRQGVILFCHEFTSHRWSCRPYCESLRTAGYDIFTFDFRNHGQSDTLAGYEPLQWVSDHDVADVKAALAYLARRDDADPQGVGILGISKGGTAALVAAADSTGVAAVVTDGAFPTHEMLVVYMRRWVAIYSVARFSVDRVAMWIEEMLARLGRPVSPWRRNNRFDRFARKARRISGRRRNCRFVEVEEAVGRLGPCPWLMIHGGRDSYVLPEVAEGLFRYAGSRSKLWLVPMAKHNKSLQVAGDQYRKRVGDFFGHHLGTTRRRTSLRPLVPTDREPLAAPLSSGE
jgi:pimeloyl-ACP methyl ester carboxylesterase